MAISSASEGGDGETEGRQHRANTTKPAA